MKQRIFGVADPGKTRVYAEEHNQPKTKKSDQDDESERSEPVNVLQTPLSTLEVCTTVAETSDVSAITQSTIDVPQTTTRRREVSDDYDDIVIARPKKLVSSSFNIEEVRKDEEEIGDTDSVLSCEEFKQLSDCYNDVLKENLHVIIKEEDDTEFCTSDVKSNWLLSKGLEDDIDFYKVPDDWIAPKRRTAAGEPKFEKVDNPGNWPHFCFRANGKGKNVLFLFALNGFKNLILLCFFSVFVVVM